MYPELLRYLCDPIDRTGLTLSAAETSADGRIVTGALRSGSGHTFQIIDGIPRFVATREETESVASFGEEWNYFNFDEFELNWLQHTVVNTFGSPEYFSGKLVVDAGGGSGMQTRWMREHGARHVICLELSDSVDGVAAANLASLSEVDLVQCSIDEPPIRDGSIEGIVICHNVIQHTRSVEDTARALWRIVAPGGELVFNCYPKNDQGFLRATRFQVYVRIRRFLSRRSFRVRLLYSRSMAVIRFVPVVGRLFELAGLMIRGEVPMGPGFRRRAYKQGLLNTFDLFGAHQYQHHKTNEEILALIGSLDPQPREVLNVEAYFRRPPPPGIALRLRK